MTGVKELYTTTQSGGRNGRQKKIYSLVLPVHTYAVNVNKCKFTRVGAGEE